MTEPKKGLFGWLRRAPETEQNTTETPAENGGFFARLKSGLKRTRSGLGEGLATLFLGKKKIDEDLLDELETQLLMADVGVDTTQMLLKEVTGKAERKELADSEALYDHLAKRLAEILENVEKPLPIEREKKPFVLLVVGVNGVGKTTTIGKLAHYWQLQGKKVMLAAGDTFRAAAVEQLQVWGERNNVPVVAQGPNADSAAVLYDALQSAQARNIDILICDTAGRLHTKHNLMDELSKVVRVLKRLDPDAPHEVLLVLDAATGQNALNQAEQFHKAVNLSGIALTKLDGTAKGGIIFALAQKMKLPIRFIGVGEGIDDLRPFHAHDFIRALFARDESEKS
ncbi:signal recognition particle-docking protein FtsY [Permianibacter aggregans]|uniref:Signal recognition particle receptor FtsY n=1 Tax=Permianibacter aggregans TaxID=1510150 RepID=A0A4R6UVH7_9GAMM|nr:signal recognition particle-docking protein FtsY [Permianibacter aggregans]TDQ49445.1 fused signal recognition particle receptor [Permianibacter aggregans]